MENSSDTIGNRTLDLPARSAVPQPTALPSTYENKLTPCSRMALFRRKLIIIRVFFFFHFS